MRVLSGTFDQSDYIRFSKYFGRQCTANAVAGACKANVVNPRLWTSQTIDECLMTGNKLFELSYELLPSTFNHLYLRPDELYSTLSFPENEITFQVEINEVFDGTSINSIATVSNDGPTNYCLHDAILCFFHNFYYGIFTCQVESIAVMKIENEYYIFDSHKRCKNGLRDGANGAAVLVCFADINELIIHLKALYRCSRCCSAPTAVCSSCQFSISPLIITNVTNIIYHAQSNANANSNVKNKRVSQLELARNAKKNKKANKLLQNNRKVPAKKQIIVNNETPSSSPAELIDKIYDLRIRPAQVKYERTPEMKAKNIEQICKRYNTDVVVKETKSKQVKEKYQNDKSFRESHNVCIYRSHLQENESGNVCSTCANHLKKGKVPHFAVVNGLLFEPLPEELTGLTTLEERLVSARIPFMQIRELGYQKQLGLKGNCVNVPIDINKTVTCLPRMDSEDDTLLVQLMRRMSDKTPYAFENVRPEKVFNAAKYLVNTQLYKQHKISLNENWLKQFHDQTNDAITDSVSSSNEDDPIQQAVDEDDLTDQQETLLTSGFVADSGIKIAPGEGNMPLSLTLDEDMDVLAFPSVYGGKQRIFKVKYTPVEIAKAEARSHDRRVATNIPKKLIQG
ncbi:Integrin alpha-PS5 [Frankliniella fusca]|uniref:Integrin alpha-PS5 n=1 Tax=Frankliniella fusca TaxID=407009 RepID=A0AAE1HRI4_9NEOP|nr:Integrin alpha-PS5 [Frankliniella fusca]